MPDYCNHRPVSSITDKVFYSFIALQDFKLHRNMFFRFWYQNPLTTPPRDVIHVLYRLSRLYMLVPSMSCTSGEVVVNQLPQRSGSHTVKLYKGVTVFGLFVCLALTWRYRLSHNQPPSYDTRQPNNKRRTVNIQRSRLLSPTGFIVIITYYFVAFVAFLISLKSFLILYYSPSVLHQQFHGMSCLPDMPIQIFACLYCQKSQQ